MGCTRLGNNLPQRRSGSCRGLRYIGITDPERSFTRREEKRLIEATRALLRTELRPPDRTQCPPSAHVRELAHRHPDLAESTHLVDYIGACPSCFAEYSGFRAKRKQRRMAIYGFASVGAIAALLLVLWLPTRAPESSQPDAARDTAHSVTPPQSPTRLVIDLTKRGVSRGGQPTQTGDMPRMLLPRASLSLVVQLPLGSEDGPYEVAIIDSKGKTLVEAQGEAKMSNYIEILPVEVNLTHMAPGFYRLRIRRAHAQWQTYPIGLTP